MTPLEALRRSFGGRASIPFSEYMELALYDPAVGFYARGGRAGRGADFLTSPEVGPLFGAVIARALDEWWIAAGRPDPFVVVEVGAGPGTLARSIRFAAPECSGSLLHVLVERSAFQRSLHGSHLPGWMGERAGFELEAFVSSPQDGGGPQFVSAAELPAVFTGVVLANELLDNLPFDILRVRADGAIEELRVVWAADAVSLDSVAEPASPALAAAVGELLARTPELPRDAWFPWQGGATGWLDEVFTRLTRGHVLVFDYGGSTAELARRSDLGWLRTFRDQQRGVHPLDAPGAQDITCDVAIDQLRAGRPAGEVLTQAEFLRRHGIDDLVAEGLAIWNERAHLGDLAAIRGRSAMREAEALLDPEGLGAFIVLHWEHRLGG
ncbi:MAG: SAM-dependent methyltransferase [Acidobacteria bacterium]|nr:SAM-dependent methyltransferase [Acidobacteriota bacterium]